MNRYTEQRKKVFSNAEIEHVWAQQKLSEGRNPQGNVFFEGPSLFSYGHHFETARFVRPGVVLVTTRTYSATTRGHISAARDAVSHLKSYDVPTFDDHNANAEAYIEGLTDALYTISRMRKDADRALKQYARDAKQAAEYVSTFKVRKALAKQIMAIYERRDNPLTPEMLAGFKKRQEVARIAGKVKRELKAAEAAKRRAELQMHYDAWKAGNELPYYVNFSAFPVALRVKENEIQTTRGASVPVIEARKLWRVLRTDVSKAIGMRIGHYTVTCLDPEQNALIVGCHTIPMREVARMAVKLGLEKEAIV